MPTRPPSHTAPIDPDVPTGTLEGLLDQPGTEVEVVHHGSNLPATAEADAGVLAMLNDPNDSWADVGDGDLAPTTRRIPYLKLNRNLDGGFTLPDTGEVVKSLDFIWMAKGVSRAWFKEAFTAGGGAPACRSSDGRQADAASPEMQNAGNCATCPMASYDEDVRGTHTNDKGHSVPNPRCREAVEALVFLPDPHGYGQLTRLRWGGIAVQPAARYWDSFFTRMPRVPPIGFVSHVDLEPMTTNFGDKLTAVFRRVSELGRKEAQPLIDERDARMKDWVEDTAADLAEGVGQDDETGAPVGEPFGDPGYQGPDF